MTNLHKYDINKNMFRYSNIEQFLAYSCAPCLCGLKPANLVSVPTEIYVHKFNLDVFFLNSKGFYIKELCSCEKCTQILIYNKKAIEDLFLQDEFCNALKFFGYSLDLPLEEILEILSKRMKFANNGYGCDKKKTFPHEVGFFLGYPVYDVLEYYKNNGRNSIFSGYWKVYSNPKRAAKIFSQYTECKELFALQIQKGLSLYELLSA